MQHIQILLIIFILTLLSCPDVPISDYMTGTLAGRVVDELEGTPIEDVLISTSPGSSSVLTNQDGSFLIEGIAEGSYTVLAIKEGYNRGTLTISIEMNLETTAPILLKKRSDDTGSISGIICDLDGNPVASANIWTTPGTEAVVSDPSGAYAISRVPRGDYTITIRKPGYKETQAPVTVTSGADCPANIVLPPETDNNHNPSDLHYLSPLSNALNIPSDGTSNLQWRCSDPDNNSLTYDIYLWTNSTDHTLAAAGITAQTYTPTLNAATTYYWMVVAKDDLGGFNVGPVWQFSTE